MKSFQNNQLHLSGWHALASSWQDQSQELPEPPKEVDRVDHATVVWTYVCKNNKISNSRRRTTTSIALIGGSLRGGTTTTSVMVLKDAFNKSSEKKWKDGPRLKVLRNRMGASICNGYVYIMGGGYLYYWYSDGGQYHEKNYYFDTIHRIPISCLFHHTNQVTSSSWTRVSARLSVPRQDCTAVTVQDRFIVVIGGRNQGRPLSSVDIIDTMTPAARRWCGLPAINGNKHHLKNDTGKDHPTVVTVSAGPRLQTPRYHIGTTILDDQIWVVGGSYRNMFLKTVECLRYGSNSRRNNSSCSIFSSPVWNSRPDLSLRRGCYENGVVAMAQCLAVVAPRAVVASSAELLDPHRGVVLKLPGMVHPLTECTVVEIPHRGLAVVGRDSSGKVHMESLPCVNLSLRQLKEYTKEIEFLRQSSSIHSSHVPDKDSQALLEGSKVESLCHSLVFYYLYHKGAHVQCEQQQREQQHRKQSLKNRNKMDTNTKWLQ